MNRFKDKNSILRVRHILIVVSLILLVFAVGGIAFWYSDSLVMMNLSKNTMAAPAQSAPVTSMVNSVPHAVSSKPSPQSTASSPLSTPPYAPPAKNPAVYQAMYPNLYAEKVEYAPEGEGKVVYLTFDDGPSDLTIPLLDVLDRYKVKATFFLIGKTDPRSMREMKEIVDRGSVVGVHSFSHQYDSIYASPAAFLNDFAKMHDLLKKATGVDTHIYRYAGGSENSHNRNTAKAIINEMNRRGYTYYDWNVSSGDAERGSTARSVYTQTISGVHSHSHSVVLFHNTKFKKDTLSQMAKIIETLQKEGYRFATLDPSVDNKQYIFRPY